jgi:hypothetical protein
MEVLQTAIETQDLTLPFKMAWDIIERNHLNLWLNAKNKYMVDAERIAAFKLESLTNNFRNRKRILQELLDKSQDSSIIRMKSREMENAEAQYERKIAEIKESTLKTDIYSRLIIKGILIVER